MLSKKVRETFLQHLEEMGNVLWACKKTGIKNTSTVYRWAQKSSTFKKKMEEAVQTGRTNAIDIAEGGMVHNAAAGDYKSQAFLLKHLSDKYKSDKHETLSQKEFERYKRECWDEITEGYRKVGEVIRDLRESDDLTEKDKEKLEDATPLLLKAPDKGLT